MRDHATGLPPTPPGCEIRLDRVDGFLVFHVGLSEPVRTGRFPGIGPRHERGMADGLRYGIVCSGDGLVGGFTRQPLHLGLRKLVAAAAEGKDEDTANALTAFDVDPVLDRRGGDVAIYLVERWERTAGRELPGTRGDRVEAMQKTLFARGLRAALDAIGPDRLRIRELLTRDAWGMIHPTVRCLSMPAVRARSIRAAADAYPAMAHGIAATWRDPRCFIPEDATEHQVAVAHLGFYGATGAQARAIARASLRPGVPERLPSVALSCLAPLPADWIPEGEREWTAFVCLAPVLKEAASITDQSVGALAAHSAGRWEEFAGRLASAAGVGLDVTPDLHAGEAFGALSGAARDLRDMFTGLWKGLAAPLVAWELGDEEPPPGGRGQTLARKILFEGRGLARILEDSRLWHAAGGVRMPGAAVGHAEWEPVLPTFRHGCVEIVPLATKAALAAEGSRESDPAGRAGLHHCVATRWTECANGMARVMGVRSAADGTRVSTFEVRFDRDLRPALTEHKGLRNAEPTAEAKAAVGAYMEAIDPREGVPRLPWDPAPLRLARARRRATNLEGECGYDWRDPDRLAEAIAAWGPYLARPLRGLRPGEFLAATLGESQEPEDAAGAAPPGP